MYATHSLPPSTVEIPLAKSQFLYRSRIEDVVCASVEGNAHLFGSLFDDRAGADYQRPADFQLLRGIGAT